jgi:hypothetical protein
MLGGKSTSGQTYTDEQNQIFIDNIKEYRYFVQDETEVKTIYFLDLFDVGILPTFLALYFHQVLELY